MSLKDVVKQLFNDKHWTNIYFSLFNIGVNNRFRLNFHDRRNCPLKDFIVITGIYKKEFEFLSDNLIAVVTIM